MHSAFISKLSDKEYRDLTKKLYDIQSGKCFICGQDINLELQETNIDHIIPLNTGGKDNENNFALTHEICNKSKQDANLDVARALYRLKIIQNEVSKSDNRAASLQDLLNSIGGSKYKLNFTIKGNVFEYVFNDINDSTIHKAEIFTDNLSKEQSVFIKVPIEYLFHDEIINPRGINSSINLLVKEFYKGNPQLHLTLARLDEQGRIKVFDGQHKAAAQILLGQKEITLRLFIHADITRLTETNANAGSKLRQIAFDKAVMRQLNNTQYYEKVKQYRAEHKLPDDDLSFSEASLCDYFKGESMKKYIIEAIKSAITTAQDNKLKDYIDFEGRGKSLPLSHSTYDKVFLAKFIDSKNILTSRMDFKSEDGMNPRELEIAQISKLLSLIAEILYVNKFNQEIGINRVEQKIIEKRDLEITDAHLIAYRMSKEEILYAWTPYLDKIIKMYLLNTGSSFAENCVFQTKFDDQLWNNLRKFLVSLSELPMWKDRSMAGTHFSGKKPTAFWESVFKYGKTPEGVQVLAHGIDYISMIK
jgi:hypothetical protein